MAVYIEQLETMDTENLAPQYWMDQGLMTGICNTLETDDFRACVWTEETALSPFSSGWMESMAVQNGNMHQHDRALIPLSMATSMYSYASNHVGYASNHHFHI
jgi:hypothetical protein